MNQTKKNLLIDLAILVLSVIFAIWLGNSVFLEKLLAATSSSEFLASFLGGLFFTSIFTAVPAVVLLGEVSQNTSPIFVSAVGALGALLGDMLMFKFLRDRLAKDFYALFDVNIRKSQFRLPRFRWLVMLVGGLIIASPFPDELGLAILGFSNTKTNLVIPISLLFNFFGILVIALLAS